MTRKRFSERAVLATLMTQQVIFCFRCKMAIAEAKDAEREHILEIALGGKDEPANCAYSHAWCHFAITNGTKATTAGSSKQRIAKVARLQNPKKSKRPMKSSKRPIPSRPFQKAARDTGPKASRSTAIAIQRIR